MSGQGDALRRLALAALGEAAYEQAVGYAEPAPRPAGPATLGPTSISLSAPAHLVFVDLAPPANWAHPACWLLIPLNDASPVVRVDVRMPPFLKADGPSVRLLWRGRDIPEWPVHDPDQRFD